MSTAVAAEASAPVGFALAFGLASSSSPPFASSAALDLRLGLRVRPRAFFCGGGVLVAPASASPWVPPRF